MSDILTPFGQLCSAARNHMTMTRPELARHLNTTPKEISDIETGKKEPSAHYITLVAGVLGLDLEEVEISLSTPNGHYQLTRITQPKYGS
jgi:transcriptional regulator with XRE-family HTH domain